MNKQKPLFNSRNLNNIGLIKLLGKEKFNKNLICPLKKGRGIINFCEEVKFPNHQNPELFFVRKKVTLIVQLI